MARRLPVIQTPSGEDGAAAERPAWHWVLVGTGFVLAVFFQLSMLAVPLGVALARYVERASALRAMLTAAPVLAAFAFSAWAAGGVVGRFGLRAKRRTAPLAGALGGAVILLLVLLRGGMGGAAVLGSMSVLLLTTGAAFARLGERFGRRRRPGATTR